MTEPEIVYTATSVPKSTALVPASQGVALPPPPPVPPPPERHFWPVGYRRKKPWYEWILQVVDLGFIAGIIIFPLRAHPQDGLFWTGPILFFVGLMCLAEWQSRCEDRDKVDRVTWIVAAVLTAIMVFFEYRRRQERR